MPAFEFTADDCKTAGEALERIKRTRALFWGEPRRPFVKPLLVSHPRVILPAQQKERPPNFSVHWTEEEVELLKRRYLDEGMPVKMIAAELGRGVGSIESKARKLGFFRKPEAITPHSTKYRPDEVATLLRLREEGKTSRQIAKQIRRSVNSIEGRITFMGLRRKKAP